MKSSQDLCLLNPIASLLLNQSHNCHLQLKAFVTREEWSNITVRELLTEPSLVQTVRFSAPGSSYAVHGPESSLWLAGLIGFTSIVFLVALICLNHIFIQTKKGNLSEKLMVDSSHKKASKEKSPSWIADLIILASFAIAITTTSILAIALRWRKLKRDLPPASPNQCKPIETTIPDDHDIHFGARPNFEGTNQAFIFHFFFLLNNDLTANQINRYTVPVSKGQWWI